MTGAFRATGRRSVILSCMRRAMPKRRFWWQVRISGADRRANMRCGRWRITAFAVVIASSFADIFANNSLKNGLLTVRLTDDQVAEIMRRSTATEGYQLTVDLENLRVDDGQGFSATFAMDEFSRHCLLNGLDDIGLTLQHEAEIAAYEAKHPVGAEMKAIL